ncbi:hypothetical protein TrRE_jg7473, partial [Triparma retinervis]
MTTRTTTTSITTKLSRHFRNLTKLRWSFLLISLLLILSGFLNLHDYSSYTSLTCTPTLCTLRSYSDPSSPGPCVHGLGEPWSVLRFPRDDFIRSRQVRVGDKGIVSAGGMKRRQARRLGYSYSVAYRGGDGEEEEALVSRLNLGKRGSRERAAKLNQKMRGGGKGFSVGEGGGYA